MNISTAVVVDAARRVMSSDEESPKSLVMIGTFSSFNNFATCALCQCVVRDFSHFLSYDHLKRVKHGDTWMCDRCHLVFHDEASARDHLYARCKRTERRLVQKEPLHPVLSALSAGEEFFDFGDRISLSSGLVFPVGFERSGPRGSVGPGLPLKSGLLYIGRFCGYLTPDPELPFAVCPTCWCYVRISQWSAHIRSSYHADGVDAFDIRHPPTSPRFYLDLQTDQVLSETAALKVAASRTAPDVTFICSEVASEQGPVDLSNRLFDSSALPIAHVNQSMIETSISWSCRPDDGKPESERIALPKPGHLVPAPDHGFPTPSCPVPSPLVSIAEPEYPQGLTDLLALADVGLDGGPGRRHCVVCRSEVFGEENWKTHISGSAHLGKVAAVEAAIASPPEIETLHDVIVSVGPFGSPCVTGPTRRCRLCDVEFSGSWSDHICSLEHRTKVRDFSADHPHLEVTRNFLCRVCNVIICGEQNCKDHCAGARHNRKLVMNRRFCEDCGQTFYSEEDFSKHVLECDVRPIPTDTSSSASSSPDGDAPCEYGAVPRLHSCSEWNKAITLSTTSDLIQPPLSRIVIPCGPSFPSATWCDLCGPLSDGESVTDHVVSGTHLANVAYYASCHEEPSPWHWCRLCAVPVRADSIQEHMESEAHKLVAAGFGRTYSCKMCKGAHFTRDQLASHMDECPSLPGIAPAKADKRFYCTVCKVCVTDEDAWKKHLSTYSHVKRMKRNGVPSSPERDLLLNMFRTGVFADQIPIGRYIRPVQGRCPLCGPYTGTYAAHVSSRQHLENLLRESEGCPLTFHTCGWVCVPCGIITTGKVPMDEHLTSKRHVRLASKRH